MVKCQHCKQEIDGKEFTRSIFIPPAIVIPQTYCGECIVLVRQRERQLCPLTLVVLMAVFIPIIIILLL